MNSRQIRTALNKEAPTLLTFVGLTGVITTAVLAVNDTLKAKDTYDTWLFDQNKEMNPTTVADKVRLVWKDYLPTALSATITCGAILAVNGIHMERNAAMGVAYTMALEGLREYQSQVMTQLSAKKHERIMEGIAEERIRQNPPSESMVVIAGGETLFYDSYSGRYFLQTMQGVKKAVNDFNYDLMTDMFKPVNEFYDLVGLPGIEAGEHMGWGIEQKLDVTFYAKIVSATGNRWDEHPCIVLDYLLFPKHL
jgi:hypothetical protein